MSELALLKKRLEETQKLIDNYDDCAWLDRHDINMLEGYCDHAEYLQSKIERLEDEDKAWLIHLGREQEISA